MVESSSEEDDDDDEGSSSGEDSSQMDTVTNSRNKAKGIQGGTKTTASKIKVVNQSDLLDGSVGKIAATETSVELSVMQDQLEKKEQEVREHKNLSS